MAKLSAVAENKDHMTHRIMSDRQLPSVQFPTDCLALNFRFSYTTRNHATARKKQSKENKRKRGKEHKRKPLSSLLTIISKIKKKPTCLYIDFFMCCLTTAILQSYTVFANVQFKMFVQKREREKKDQLHCQSDQMGLNQLL